MRPINLTLRTVQTTHLAISLFFFFCIVQSLFYPIDGFPAWWQFEGMAKLGNIISWPLRLFSILPIKAKGFLFFEVLLWCLAFLWAILLASLVVFILKYLTQGGRLLPKISKKTIKNILLILSISLIAIYNEFTLFKEPNFFLEEDKKHQFAELPGALKFKIEFNEEIIYEIDNGQLIRNNSLPFPSIEYEKRLYNYHWKEDIVKGPMIEGYLYNGPYKFNNDKSLAVFSLSSKDAADSNRRFVLLNWKTKAVIFLSNIDCSLEDIVWSPDSQMFAVLETLNEGPPVSILATLAGFAGHPSFVRSYFLSIYNNKGQLIVKSKIADRLIIYGGNLSWD